MLSSEKALAVARAGLGVATLCNTLEVYAVLRQVADGRYGMPLFAWVPAPTGVTVSMYLLLATLASIAITVGLGVVVAATASTVLSCLVLLWDQQAYSNHLWLAVILVALLIPSHAGSFRPGQRESRTRKSPPRWPQVLMMVQLSVCYAFAALSKVNPVFLSGQPLGGWIRWEWPLWLTMAMSVATVVVELFLAAGLWFARTRRLTVGVGVALHLSIVVMIENQTFALIAFSLICFCIYPLFFVPRASDGPDLSVSPAPESRPSGRPS